MTWNLQNRACRPYASSIPAANSPKGHIGYAGESWVRGHPTEGSAAGWESPTRFKWKAPALLVRERRNVADPTKGARGCGKGPYASAGRGPHPTFQFVQKTKPAPGPASKTTAALLFQAAALAAAFFAPSLSLASSPSSVSGRSISSTSAIGALSPWRNPRFKMRR